MVFNISWLQNYILALLKGHTTTNEDNADEENTQYWPDIFYDESIYEITRP